MAWTVTGLSSPFTPIRPLLKAARTEHEVAVWDGDLGAEPMTFHSPVGGSATKTLEQLPEGATAVRGTIRSPIASYGPMTAPKARRLYDSFDL